MHPPPATFVSLARSGQTLSSPSPLFGFLLSLSSLPPPCRNEIVCIHLCASVEAGRPLNPHAWPWLRRPTSPLIWPQRWHLLSFCYSCRFAPLRAHLLSHPEPRACCRAVRFDGHTDRSKLHYFRSRWVHLRAMFSRSCSFLFLGLRLGGGKWRG